MLEFRKKILINSVGCFVLFFAAITPFVRATGWFLFLLYGLVNWILIRRVSRPLQQIFDAITPYQEEALLPRIVLNEGEFSKLASTLNSLNQRVQKQLDTAVNQQKETEGILDSLGEGVIAFDPTAKVTFANRVATQMLSVERGKTLGASGLEEKCHELVLQALQTAERTTESWTEKGLRYLELTSAPLVHQSGAILVLQDKTADRKIVEMGKDFIANASHELRTPITVLRGFAETLSDFPKLSPKVLAEIATKIVRTSERLDKLIKSLLTLADIENVPESRFVPIELVSLAENCKHLLLTAHPEVRLVLATYAPQVYVRGDPDLVDLSLMNLLENAVRYSPAPAEISLSLQECEGGIALRVADRGIGIPPQDLPHIFGRFYTVDKARSRKSGGSGLGLSIVKTVVEKHGWSISATSEMHQGSVFTVQISLC